MKKGVSFLVSGSVEPKSLIERGTIIGIVTADKISKPAKKLLDAAGITWAENVSEADFIEDSERHQSVITEESSIS